MQPPKSQEEFEQAIAAIDAEMVREGVPIPMRDLEGSRRYSVHFGLELPWAFQQYRGAPGVFVGRDAAAHIRDWFQARYGDRLSADFTLGTTMFLLKGDLWELRLPRVYGNVTFVVDPDLARFADSPVLGKSRPPTVNVLSLIEKLTPAFARQLSPDDLQYVGDTFIELWRCRAAIESFRELTFAVEALTDLSASVRHALAYSPHPGQSKYSSAQAAEKFIKCYLRSKKIKFPFTHKLNELVQLSAGKLTFNQGTLDCLATGAGPRYGEVSVTLPEAVMAHHAALLVGREVGRTLDADQEAN